MKAQDYYRLYTLRQVDLSDIPKSRVFKTIELVTKDNPTKILDVGCGRRVIPQLFKKRDNEVVGIGINEEQGNIASKKLDNIIIQDAEEKWNVPDIYFDVVHMGAFLEHIFDYHHALSEANRVFPGICNVLIAQAIKTQEIKVEYELIKGVQYEKL